MKIIMLGPQGCGKGTQAKILSKKSGLAHISTGDVLRELAHSETELGDTIKEIMNSGSLVPDEMMVEILRQRVHEDDARKGFILDGFPRTIAQAKALDEIMDIDAVFYIRISDTEAVHRISSRVQCKQCNEVYGEANPPLEKGICDRCFGELYQRDDDKPEAIKKRLERFHKEIKPIMDHYKKILHIIDGERPIEKISEDIEEEYKKAKKQ